jgi:hypothetical protein
MIQEGQIVLFAFPQTDQVAGRLRPTLVLQSLPALPRNQPQEKRRRNQAIQLRESQANKYDVPGILTDIDKRQFSFGRVGVKQHEIPVS